jgi:hypothetical protein
MKEPKKEKIRITIAVENFEKKYYSGNEVFILGKQLINPGNIEKSCFIVFNTKLFNETSVQLSNLEKPYRNNKGIIEITDYLRYVPTSDKIKFVSNLPDSDIFKVLNFQIIPV